MQGTIEESAKVGPQKKRISWGIVAIVVVSLAIGGIIVRPWEIHYRSLFEISQAFTTALQERDAATLERLAYPNSPHPVESVQRILGQLPPGELSLARLEYQSDMAPTMVDLTVTLTSGGLDRTVNVGLRALTDPVGDASNDWFVVYY
jgi:hypothetical protein